MVMLGMILSIYELNKNLISNYTRFTKDIKLFSNKNKIDVKNSIKDNDIEASKDDSLLSLVETIEELGFIPSIKNNDDKPFA
tara:strand:- start:77 stop:322 length:246 start_codon:yes stop_codon:yes gene_type:complete